MDIEWIQTQLTEENILSLLEQYRTLGPLPGILLPMLESLLPILPLFLFVAGNAVVYGLWQGFLYSWIGAVLGSLFVFFIVRRLASEKFMQWVYKHKKIKSGLHWFEKHGFGAVFLMFCFPFTPSAFINVIAGLSKMNVKTFSLALVLGKMVMIFIVSFIGHDFIKIVKKPLELTLIVCIIAALWVVGKVIEAYLKKRTHKGL
ncbi:TVP38/TMEM64 family protein [Bacillus taeanensis]|uniref:TVP38/TMEM64 family membrane protein n=1 Tax=Bacillus taeanensis TaxID=273032 RepID=A0A366XUA1_9BACI|nr:TVP38/TMEM64 family protein [Bacillus taeanensis]RBW69236.1 TVP38/TMEM64 family protein [Bacillus taeanensis]